MATHWLVSRMAWEPAAKWRQRRIQFANRSQQHVVLRRQMRRRGGIGPRGPGIIVALAADVDLGIVVVGEDAVGGHEVVVGRSQGITQLRRIAVGLMRVMAVDALDCQGWRRSSAAPGPRSGSSAPSRSGSARSCQSRRRRSDWRSPAGARWFAHSLYRTGMAAAAHRGGELHARDQGWIIRIGRRDSRPGRGNSRIARPPDSGVLARLVNPVGNP